MSFSEISTAKSLRADYENDKIELKRITEEVKRLEKFGEKYKMKSDAQKLVSKLNYKEREVLGRVVGYESILLAITNEMSNFKPQTEYLGNSKGNRNYENLQVKDVLPYLSRKTWIHNDQIQERMEKNGHNYSVRQIGSTMAHAGTIAEKKLVKTKIIDGKIAYKLK